MANMNTPLVSNLVLIEIDKRCRTCLNATETMYSIYNKLENILEEHIQTIADILTKITFIPVMKDDGLPTTVCSKCIVLIGAAYQFKMQFDQTYDILEKYQQVAGSKKQNTFLILNEKVANIIGGNAIQNKIAETNKKIQETNNIPNNNASRVKTTTSLLKTNRKQSRKRPAVKTKPVLIKPKRDKILESIDKVIESYSNLDEDNIVVKVENDESLEDNLVNKENDFILEVDDDVVIKEENSIQEPFLKKVKQEKTFESTEKLNEISEIEEEEKIVKLPCPICPKELTILGLKKHIKKHKSLRKYLSIPDSEKVKPGTKFYAQPKMKKPTISILNREGVIKHKCVFCNEEHEASTLSSHLSTHKTKKEFECNVCNRIFSGLNHLNTHKVSHLKELPYKCKQCGKGFVMKSNYDCHVLTHSEEALPHECKFCLKRFANPKNLYKHAFIHTENITYGKKYKVHRCTKCLVGFSNKKECDEHDCVVKDAVRKLLTCKICGKVFTSRATLHNHNKNMHHVMESGGRRGFYHNPQRYNLCTLCGKHVVNLTLHMLRHNGEKKFECHLCDKKFLTKGQLTRHLAVHSGVKPYMCSMCPKVFTTIYAMQAHERVHIGNRCHVCHICNKGFLERSYLNQHVKRVHKLI